MTAQVIQVIAGVTISFGAGLLVRAWLRARAARQRRERRAWWSSTPASSKLPTAVSRKEDSRN
jgi:hypothetical protein